MPAPRPGNPEQQGVRLDHVTVVRLKLVAGNQERGEGGRFGLTAVRVQRHLLFPRRHLFNRATDILGPQRETETRPSEIS